MQIVPFDPQYLERAFEFCEAMVGEGYFSREELASIIEKSRLSKPGETFKSCSFIALNGLDQVIGVRLTYPPGKWDHKTRLEKGLSTDLWRVDRKDTAYFQTIFVSNECRGTGAGVKLSEQSIKVLRDIGAKAIVCHSWKESPNNSSQRYLEKLGFEVVRELGEFWGDVDYLCTGCNSNPCSCTATEMIKYL